MTSAKAALELLRNDDAGDSHVLASEDELRTSGVLQEPLFARGVWSGRVCTIARNSRTQEARYTRPNAIYGDNQVFATAQGRPDYRLNLLVSAAFQRGVHSASASALDVELEKTNRRPGAAPGAKFEHWTEVSLPSFLILLPGRDLETLAHCCDCWVQPTTVSLRTRYTGRQEDGRVASEPDRLCCCSTLEEFEEAAG